MQTIYISLIDKEKNSQLIVDGQFYLFADFLEIFYRKEDDIDDIEIKKQDKEEPTR